MGAAEQWVWLARIRKAQGRKGEVFADLLTDFPEKFEERRRLWLVPEPGHVLARPGKPTAAREVELAAHWLHKGGIVLHFAGVDSISAAETLVGLGVAIPRAERVTLAEGEAYVSDLIGCAVVDVAGREPIIVGVIEDVDTTAGPVPLLVVGGATTGAKKRGEILIPFATSYLQKLDLDERRVEMALPEGLVDLNG